MYELSTLDNGLRVLTVTMPYLQSVSMGFLVGVGSRYENDEQAGASHFIEHMLFKGTPRRPSARHIAEAIEGRGGVFNASTGVETTLYWAKVAASHLSEALDVVSDMLLNAAFDADDLEKERAVIAEEIHYALDAPYSLAHILVNQLQWPDHPLGRDVAGTQESVDSISRDTLLDYLSAHYRPGRTILSVAGPTPHQEILALVESYLGGWEPGPPMDYEPAPALEPGNGPAVRIAHKDTEQVQLSFSLGGVSRSDPERFALRLLSILLGEGMRSRLFQEVRERQGLAYSVGSYVTTLQDTGAVGSYAGVAPDKTEDAIRAIMHQLDLLAQEPAPEDELQAARDFVSGRMALSLEDPFTLAAWYARQELLEDQILSPEETIGLLDSVQATEIQKVAQELFRTNRLNLVIVGPFSEDESRFRRAILD